MRRRFALALVLVAFGAGAQPVDQEWLASRSATEFRDRVVQLALIYGESSGIDPQGFKVQARETAKADGGCADVEVVTFEADRVVRRETVHACSQH